MTRRTPPTTPTPPPDPSCMGSSSTSALNCPRTRRSPPNMSSGSSIAQLAAEYDTIAAAAQHDRWAALIRTSGLSDDDAGRSRDRFDARTARCRPSCVALRRTTTTSTALLPRLVRQGGSRMPTISPPSCTHRLARVTVRPAGSGRIRQAPRLIAGLIPHASGITDPEMHQALTERETLIEQRAGTLLTHALDEGEPWTAALGPTPEDAAASRWRRMRADRGRLPGSLSDH